MKQSNRSKIVKLSNSCGAILMVASLVFHAQTQAQEQPSEIPVNLPKEVTINGIELVLIPEGWFYANDGISTAKIADAGTKPAKVWVDSYYIAKYEARATDLVNLLNSKAGRDLNYDGGEENCAIRQTLWGSYKRIRAAEDLPATHLSWNQASALALWKGMRLPSVAEWEKAARGTDQRRYPWGDQYPDETYAGYLTRSSCFTWPVNSFKKGRSPYGIHNMAGNIYEYTADGADQLRETVSTGLARDPATVDVSPQKKVDATGRKILKGGRWASTEPHIRIDSHYSYPADKAYSCYGARFAMDADAVRQHLDQGTATISRI